MSSTPRTMRRDQLARFLPTLEMIIAFERLFQQATETTPEDVSSLEELLYSYGRRATTDARLAKRIDDLEAMAGSRRDNLNSLQNDINAIKAYLGI